ncbi:MAG: ABC transporter ATP-binding protein [Trueperaceae bacterium]|nr:ABC transporter ATP-binding protein [Trueperaceae bacterium]
MSAAVELNDVTLRYGADPNETPALRGVNLNVPAGDFAAVVGRSGCGKSSLLKLVSGLQPATHGTVSVDGEPVTRPVGVVGMAFQNSSLLPWRSTLENVLLPLEVVAHKRRDYRKNKKQYEQRACELLATVGLAGQEQTPPKSLSGGMRQRVSLCRALIHEPQLLLLDEPFGALDAFTKEELWQVLQELWRATGCTVILITHDLSEAVLLANTVYVMGPRPGRMIYRADIALKRPRELNDRFDRDFIDTVAELRHHIGQSHAGRQAA